VTKNLQYEILRLLEFRKVTNQFEQTVIVFLFQCSMYNMFVCCCRGPSLIQYLENLPPISRMDEGPVRLPIVDRYKVDYYFDV